MEKKIEREGGLGGLLATGAVFGAVAASTCCVLPLLFVSVGISGAWIGTLTKLAPYQPVFLLFAAACIAGGFWVASRNRPVVCDGPVCGTPGSRRATWIALWAGTIISMIAGSAEWWARFLN